MATASTPSYVLTYFNSRGLAEISRILFAAAGVEYKDVRVSREEWAALKPNTPFQQIPTLSVNGKVYGQSQAIARYIAREHGLYGANNLEGIAIDSIIEALLDARKPIGAARALKDETEKKAKIATYFADEWPSWGAKLNGIIASNNEGKGWSVGSKISIADVAIFQFVHSPDFGIDKLASYPAIAAIVSRVETHPPIAAWLAKRPVTEF